MSESDGSFGASSLVALATGGMVGGGIYVALGVVVEAAGPWTWLSFVIAGFVATTTAASYAELSNHFEAGGGSFAFLEKIQRRGAAGSLSWVLIIAYTLTIALYGFAFGRYVAHAFGAGSVTARVLSTVILAALIGLNLMGAGKLKVVEIAIVSLNLAALVVLAVIGLSDWRPDRLEVPAVDHSVWSAWSGAAAIFVSYEGFQLLTYEYDEIREPRRILRRGLVWSSIAVVAIYVAVGLGATMIVGAPGIVDSASVSLAVAAENAAGTVGLVVMTVAAAFATSAAINSTLYSSAQLARRVAEDGELPVWLDERNEHGVPSRAIIGIGAVAALLAVMGSLSSLVEAASIAFLAAFGTVNVIAWRLRVGSRWVSGAAVGVGTVVAAVLVVRLITTKPIAFGLIVVLFLVAFLVRPRILAHVAVETDDRAAT
ncbi:MAG: APC family permease [Ilumatobacter sp.]|uniref:APC family permease n=1 Tax=Ilumatobacter sp. TaxID=1967498 RepID=UPI003C729EB5